MSAAHTPGCELCGAPVGWVSGHKLESSNLIGHEFLKTISGLRETSAEFLGELENCLNLLVVAFPAAPVDSCIGVATIKARAAIDKATGGAT